LGRFDSGCLMKKFLKTDGYKGLETWLIYIGSYMSYMHYTSLGCY